MIYARPFLGRSPKRRCNRAGG